MAARPSPAPLRGSVITAAAVLGIAVALTAWAGTRPSYDAYGWLVWGHMTLHGGLDTNAAPSWKPLPYLFTVAFGLLGSATAMWLWMGTAVAAALTGVVLAGRLARRIALSPHADADPGARRIAGAIAGTLAAASLLAVHDEFPYGYLHYVLSAQSDPMVVACVLGALELALDDRPMGAFAALALAALGRPEAWPELLVAAGWLWRSRPESRAWVIAALGAVGLLWFGVARLSSRSWWVAADNADASGFGPRGNRALGVLGRFLAQTPWPLQLAALGEGVAGVWRRERAVVLLVTGTVVWIAVEVGFGLHGWPALGRYMFEPSAAVVVLGAGFAGRAIATATHRRAARPTVRATAGLFGAAVIAGTVPTLVAQGAAERSDLIAQRARTRSLTALQRAVADYGPARLRTCGEVISDGLKTQTVLADAVGENVDRVGYRFPQSGDPDNPIVVFAPRADGRWRVFTRRQTARRCRVDPGGDR